MRDSNYIVILAWMMTRLNLSGNELLCYALIYSYSQDEEGGYFGSLTHTAERLNISRRAVVDVLQRLCDKGHLKKKSITIGGCERTMYAAIPPPMEKEKIEQPKPQRQPAVAKLKKPTAQEVAAYCRERGNNIDAQRFVDYYEANGWVQGRGKPIRDWRAAVRTWEKLQIKTYANGQRIDKESVLADRSIDLVQEIADLDALFCAKLSNGDATIELPVPT